MTTTRLQKLEKLLRLAFLNYNLSRTAILTHQSTATVGLPMCHLRASLFWVLLNSRILAYFLLIRIDFFVCTTQHKHFKDISAPLLLTGKRFIFAAKALPGSHCPSLSQVYYPKTTKLNFFWRNPTTVFCNELGAVRHGFYHSYLTYTIMSDDILNFP